MHSECDGVQLDLVERIYGGLDGGRAAAVSKGRRTVLSDG